MSILKSLAFTAVTKGRKSPLLVRRDQVAARLSDQLSLVRDPNYTRTVRRWRQQDGQKVQVDHPIRVRPWWTTDEKSQTIMTVKHGLRSLEFEKGKTGIVVGPKQTLAEVIEALISATRAGELDAILEQSRPPRPAGKKKAA